MKQWLAALLLLGMAIPAPAQSSHDNEKPGQSAAAAIIAPLRDKWARDLHGKQIDASVAAYDSDAEFIQPDGSRVRGAVALRHLFEAVTTTLDSDIAFDPQRIETSGDLVYDSGAFRETLTTRATGRRELAIGSYLTIYHRAPNGGWLIVEQMWNGSPTTIALNLAAHPIVALTFDDLPAAGALPTGLTRTKIATDLAATLNANHLTGTYGFVNAVRMQNNPDAQQALHAWVDAGMNIGSHTWAHPSLNGTSIEAFEQQIAQNEPVLAEYAGSRDWHWFRYPFLWEGDTLDKRHAVRTYLHEHGYKIAQVSLDFEDYAWNDAYGRCLARQDNASIDWLKQSYLETATEYIRLGREEQLIAFGHEIPNVILLHETAFTTLMLPDLLKLLRNQGFTFSSLPEIEQDSAYALDPDAPLKYGGTLPDQFMDSRHLKYPPFNLKPFDRLKTICQ